MYEYSSRKCIAEIGRLDQKASDHAFMRKNATKYFFEVNKVQLCKKIISWLEKKNE